MTVHKFLLYFNILPHRRPNVNVSVRYQKVYLLSHDWFLLIENFTVYPIRMVTEFLAQSLRSGCVLINKELDFLHWSFKSVQGTGFRRCNPFNPRKTQRPSYSTITVCWLKENLLKGTFPPVIYFTIKAERTLYWEPS